MCAIAKTIMESPGEEAGRSTAPAPHPPATNGSNKIIGRNVNGTMVVTSAPSNEAELQLYRVMQRASLLAYYDTLLEMGGDDVQQLCDAGEEEFLEIMALVGMASKPLHVRRLQKALQEWVNNPALFQVPIVPNICPTENPFIQCNQRLLGIPAAIPSIPRSTGSPERSRPAYSPSPLDNSCGSSASAPVTSPSPAGGFNKIVLPTSPAPAAPVSASSSPQGAGSPGATPTLLPAHVRRLATAAAALSARLPPVEPRAHNHKKKACKELEAVMALPSADARRMDQIRKYAAIYGRFDCKRKPEKPLTLHELLVNEAAAQLCGAVPALLTRRDELFPLARQLVRRAGLHYSKHGLPVGADDEDPCPAKRTRQDRDEPGRSPDQPRSNSNQGWWGKTESEDGDSRCSHCSDTTPPPPRSSAGSSRVSNNGPKFRRSGIAVKYPSLPGRGRDAFRAVGDRADRGLSFAFRGRRQDATYRARSEPNLYGICK